MKLGNFSVSLAVKDINASRKFYEALGFSAVHGDPTNGWSIMKNGASIIGLFQGMIEKNTLTFNPGWDESGTKLESFDDIRQIQQNLKANGVQCSSEVDPNSKGPASFSLLDPDGNLIMIDQHV